MIKPILVAAALLTSTHTFAANLTEFLSCSLKADQEISNPMIRHVPQKIGVFIGRSPAEQGSVLFEQAGTPRRLIPASFSGPGVVNFEVMPHSLSTLTCRA